jgi:hypothetical protein
MDRRPGFKSHNLILSIIYTVQIPLSYIRTLDKLQFHFVAGIKMVTECSKASKTYKRKLGQDLILKKIDQSVT